MNSSLLTDGYKLDHRRQYPEGTEYVYSNWTPRSNHYLPEAKGAVVFGIQYMLQRIFIDDFDKNFFQLPKEEAVKTFKHRIDTFLGKENQVGTGHITALHELGYLPVRVKALPEGEICPIGCPMLTIVNTHPDFFWVTNFLETVMSCELWLPMTSATIAHLYKKEMKRHADKTGFKDVDFLCHDFSMRGMGGIEASILSGMGHLVSFCGSETIPAINAIEKYYGVDSESYLIAATIPATEHSVMCAGGFDDEYQTFKRLITKVYPSGFVSVVSDTWDFWKVITEYLPKLKGIILGRDGRLVIRPDSGDPVKIIAGYTAEEIRNYYADFGTEPIDRILPEHEIKGAYECLLDLFGYTLTEKGYKMLDCHIGMIYGDSITMERQKEIYRRLEAKGICASNLVLGIGSYTYQYKTRDCLGFAMKATWCQINGVGKEIFKHPKTDDGTKNSLKGLIVVEKDENGKYVAHDCVSPEKEKQGCLETVFENGKIKKAFTFEEIRNNLKKYE